MNRPERDKILEHDYDGIREYDNPLPGWWVAIFYCCVVWAACYFWWYQLGPGISDLDAHERAVRDHRRSEAATLMTSGPASEDTIGAAASHDLVMSHAATLYAERCASCHGDRGQGGTGPNLTDDYWNHGGGLTDIAGVLRDGLPDAGMDPAAFTLRDDEVYGLAAFVGSMRGTHPPHAKAPEGTQWVPGTASGAAAAAVDAEIRAFAKDPTRLAAGRTTFATRCSPCHGAQGQGLIGPNLTDDAWIHGGRLSDIVHTITEGVPAKGMLSWKSQLSPDEIRQVAAFVATLRGTHPPNPKPPQGDVVPANPLAE